MTWQDQLRPGSFRGAGFEATSHSSNFGRRVANNEYPFRDLPFTQDLGRKQRKFSITCFVVGTDYFPQRDALRRACEREGFGTLIHPWLGQIVVQCADCSITETAKNGGMAVFNLSFSEPGNILFPRRTDTKFQLSGFTSTLVTAAKTHFDRVIDFSDNVTFTTNALIDDLGQFSGTLNDSLSRFKLIPAAADAYVQFLGTVGTVLDALTPAGTPSSQDARNFIDASTLLSGTSIEDDRERTVFFLDLKDDVIIATPGGESNLPLREAERTNAIAVQDYSQIILTVAAIELIANTNDITNVQTSSTFKSEKEIENAQENISDFLEELMFRDSLSDLFQELDATRKAFITNTETIKRNFDVELFKPLSLAAALYLNNRVLQDSTGYEEFTIRNDVFNPMFVRSGEELEFLNSA